MEEGLWQRWGKAKACLGVNHVSMFHGAVCLSFLGQGYPRLSKALVIGRHVLWDLGWVLVSFEATWAIVWRELRFFRALVCDPFEVVLPA